MDGMEGMFQGLDIAASAMTAEMLRARVVSANLANMHVVGGKGHEPYRRKGVVFEELLEGGGAGLDGSRRLARRPSLGRRERLRAGLQRRHVPRDGRHDGDRAQLPGQPRGDAGIPRHAAELDHAHR
jgi:hypothetical protein